MKGRNSFTSFEVLKIKRLIAEKIIASTDKQKGIRQKIRNLGLYYSDFSPKREGYTVADFESLIRTGKIKIVDKNYKPTVKAAISKPIKKSKPTIKPVLSTKSSTNFNSILKAFTQNRFEPSIYNEKMIDNSPGNYILCLKKKSKLPVFSIKPKLLNFQELQVIYTGIASRSLKTRDFKQHFKSDNAGSSTLRKSLGVLFGYKQVPRDKDPNTGKTKFSQTDEQELSQWMKNNLIMFFFPTLNFNYLEIELINHFNPPLNLKDNNNAVNSEFRKLLSDLRAKKI